MDNYRPKNQVIVGGKMNEETAGKVGLRLASAAQVAAWGITISGILTAAGFLVDRFL